MFISQIQNKPNFLKEKFFKNSVDILDRINYKTYINRSGLNTKYSA